MCKITRFNIVNSDALHDPHHLSETTLQDEFAAASLYFFSIAFDLCQEGVRLYQVGADIEALGFMKQSLRCLLGSLTPPRQGQHHNVVQQEEEAENGVRFDDLMSSEDHGNDEDLSDIVSSNSTLQSNPVNEGELSFDSWLSVIVLYHMSLLYGRLGEERKSQGMHELMLTLLNSRSPRAGEQSVVATEKES